MFDDAGLNYKGMGASHVREVSAGRRPYVGGTVRISPYWLESNEATPQYGVVLSRGFPEKDAVCDPSHADPRDIEADASGEEAGDCKWLVIWHFGPDHKVGDKKYQFADKIAFGARDIKENPEDKRYLGGDGEGMPSWGITGVPVVVPEKYMYVDPPEEKWATSYKEIQQPYFHGMGDKKFQDDKWFVLSEDMCRNVTRGNGFGETYCGKLTKTFG